MSFAETNDNVAGVESANRRLLGPPPSLAGVELTEGGLNRTLDAHLASAVRGRVEPGREAEAVAVLRDKFSVAFNNGITQLAARDGRPVGAALAEELAALNPRPADDPRVAALRARIQEQVNRRNPFAGSPVGPPPPHGHVMQLRSTYQRGER